jgi:hypothetical protein
MHVKSSYTSVISVVGTCSLSVNVSVTRIGLIDWHKYRKTRALLTLNIQYFVTYLVNASSWHILESIHNRNDRRTFLSTEQQTYLYKMKHSANVWHIPISCSFMRHVVVFQYSSIFSLMHTSCSLTDDRRWMSMTHLDVYRSNTYKYLNHCPIISNTSVHDSNVSYATRSYEIIVG